MLGRDRLGQRGAAAPAHQAVGPAGPEPGQGAHGQEPGRGEREPGPGHRRRRQWRKRGLAPLEEWSDGDETGSERPALGGQRAGQHEEVRAGVLGEAAHLDQAFGKAGAQQVDRWRRIALDRDEDRTMHSAVALRRQKRDDDGPLGSAWQGKEERCVEIGPGPQDDLARRAAVQKRPERIDRDRGRRALAQGELAARLVLYAGIGREHARDGTSRGKREEHEDDEPPWVGESEKLHGTTNGITRSWSPDSLATVWRPRAEAGAGSWNGNGAARSAR
jgi:hypothetical protein